MKLIMTNKPMRNTIRNVALVLFALFFLSILGSSIFANKTVLITFSPLAPIIAGIILIVGYRIYYVQLKRKIKRKTKKQDTRNEKRRKTICYLLLIIVLLIVQLIIAYSCFSEYGWDCQTVLENAKKLHQNETINTNYFSTCDNNIGILLFFKQVYTFIGFFTAIQNYTWIAVCLNLLMIDIACFLTIHTIRKQFNQKATKVGIFLILPLLFFSPWILIPYTDTLTMTFPIAIYTLYLVYKESREKKETKPRYSWLIVLWFLTLIAMIGTILKPTTLIMVMAIIVIELFYWTKKKWDKAYFGIMISTFLVIALGIVIVYLSFNGLKQQELGEQIPQELYKQNSLPITHYMMMGLKEQPQENTNKSSYGIFNHEDYGFTTSFQGREEKVKQNVKVIGERLQEKGIGGYISFLFHKAEWILSDGTFFYGFEGNFTTTEPYATSKLASQIQPYYEIDTDQYNHITINVMQIAWLIVQVGIILSVFLRLDSEKKNKEADILKLAIVGIICFVLLFEGRSRYLISYIPIFILVGIQGLVAIVNIIKKRTRRVLEKTPKVYG